MHRAVNAASKWDRRRSADWQAVLDVVNERTIITSYIAITTRGFTGHEMLDQVGLTHMSGRNDLAGFSATAICKQPLAMGHVFRLIMRYNLSRKCKGSGS